MKINFLVKITDEERKSKPPVDISQIMVSRHFSVKLSLPSILSLKKTESDEFVSLNFNKFNYNNIDDNDINNNSKSSKILYSSDMVTMLFNKTVE